MGKPAILFDNILDKTTPVASSTATGDYDVLNLRAGRTYTWWKPSAMAASIDAAFNSNYPPADTFALWRHDLGTQASLLSLFGEWMPFTGQQLLTYPEEFDNAAWAKSAVTVTANALAAPDNTQTADLLDETAATGYHHVSRSYAATDNQDYTLTVYAKAGTRQYLWLEAQKKDGVTFPVATFDLSAGTVTASNAVVNASITLVYGGWYRCRISWNAGTGATANPALYIGINNSGGIGSSYLGATGNTLYVWGAMLSLWSSWSPYTAVSGWMDTSWALLNFGGNKLSNPEAFTSWAQGNLNAAPNAAGAPDGTMTAETLEDISGSGWGYVQSNLVAAVSGFTHCASIFVKKDSIGRATRFPSLKLITVGPAFSASVNLDTATGEVASASSGAGVTNVTVGCEAVAGDWWRIWVAATFTDPTITGCMVQFFPATGAGAGWPASAATTGKATAWGAMLNDGATPFRYIAQSNPPLFALFSSVSRKYWRVRISGATAPALAAMWIGERMTFPNWLDAPFDPLARKIGGKRYRNNNGQPMGRSVDYETWEQEVHFGNVPWAWYRSVWLPAWNARLRSSPSVFAWDPEIYPSEARLVTAAEAFETPHDAGSIGRLSLSLSGPA